MIIILEGPDGAGKSTLANKLRIVHHAEYHHEGPPPHGDVLRHYGEVLQRYRGRTVIIDRFALGERVYGPILRGNDALGTDGWRVLQRLITAAGAHELLCMPPYETCRDNWVKKKALKDELFEDESLLRQAYDGFDRLGRETHMRRYDYRLDPIPAYQPVASLPPEFIGSPTATYLFIGDRGSDLASSLDLPFFGVTDSAKYLNAALTLAGFEEHEIAFMNAYPLRSVQPHIIPRDSFKIVTLGEHASAVCSEQEVEHVGVPHPQFWRRFHHADIQSYADMLRSCR